MLIFIYANKMINIQKINASSRMCSNTIENALLAKCCYLFLFVNFRSSQFCTLVYTSAYIYDILISSFYFQSLHFQLSCVLTTIAIGSIRSFKCAIETTCNHKDEHPALLLCYNVKEKRKSCQNGLFPTLKLWISKSNTPFCP